VPAYSLPELPYDVAALEPHYPAEILALHHDKHHAGYVTGLNTTLDQLTELRESGNYGGLVGLEKTMAFNLSGHILHSLFWQNLSPDGGDKPVGELAAALDESFGSFDAFRDQLTQATVLGEPCRGSRSADGCSSSRSTTTTATSASALRRSSSSTLGSTRTT